MSETSTRFLKEAPTVARSGASLGFKLGIGAALIAVPLGSALVFMQLKSAGAQKNLAQEQGASYEANSVGRIDPALIKFEDSGRIATGLKYARAIAVDNKGRILIAGDRKVRILGADSELLSEIALPDYPTCVAPGADGTVLVGLRDHVETYSPEGVRQKIWDSFGPHTQLTGLSAVGQEVLVADAGRRVVVRCDLDGRVLGELGRRDEGSGGEGLVLPSPYLNVKSLPDGQVMVNNPGRHRVETYSASGELTGFFGTAGGGIAGFIGCCNPSHFALMTDGRIVTAEKGAGRIKVYLPDGKLDGVVAGPELLGSGLHGFELAVDAEDRILVLEPGATEVRVFAKKKTVDAAAIGGAL
jgi:hypothetical protein